MELIRLHAAKRNWRTSVIFLIAFWIILLATSLSLAATFLSTFFTSSPARQLVSFDWSGYVVVSNFGTPEPLVVGVNGSWTVPQVSISLKDTFSAAWIGVGGQLDTTLIQTGTEHDSINGHDTYSAWYELLPSDEVTITTMNISPGDKITASINLVDPATNQWSVEIADVATGQRFEQNFSYDSSSLSAEWVVERPTVDHTVSTLANFGTITFTDASANMNGTSGAITSFPFAKVALYNRQNVQLVTVSSLTSRGSSFTVSYLDSLALGASWTNELFENEIALASAPSRSGPAPKTRGMFP